MKNTIQATMPAKLAERINDTERARTPQEEAQIELRTPELIAEKMADRETFYDLMYGIDTELIDGPLHRCLMNLDEAIRGISILRIRAQLSYAQLQYEPALDAVTAALSEIQRTVRAEAETVYRDECEAMAEREL